MNRSSVSRGAQFALVAVFALLASGCASIARADVPIPATCPVPASNPLRPEETPGVAIAPGQIDAAVAQVDGLARALMASSNIPGMAVAVVVDGKTVFAKGYGVRSLSSGGVVDADTVFQLASVSKSVGAVVVARQVGQGVVGWDTSIQTWLPSFTLADDYVGSHVTIGDMYAHRSGLPDHAGDLLEDLGYNRDEIFSRLHYLPLTPFRAHYAYTNIGLTAGAQAVANASGTDWASLSDKVLYTPLGMTSTSSRYSDFIARSNYAVGHIKVDGAYRVTQTQRDPDQQSPAGGVSSSVNDMSRWMNLVLAQGCLNGQALVGRDALLAATSAQSVQGVPATPQARGSFYGYGFGVGTSAAGRVTLAHSGAFVAGAATAYTLIPSTNVGIVVLTNAEPGGVPETLAAEFVDLVQFGTITQDWKTLYANAFKQLVAPIGSLAGKTPPAHPVPAKSITQYVGIYANDYYGPARISFDNGTLMLNLGRQQTPFPLTHWDGDIFTFTPPGESGPIGSISMLTFNKATLTIEYLNDEGLGTFSLGYQRGRN